MNPKKSAARKSKSAGISLEPSLIKSAKEFAEKNGFGSLSNYVRFILTQELKRLDTGERLIIETDSTRAQWQRWVNDQPGNAEPLPHNRGVAPASAASITVDPSVKCGGGSQTPKTIRYPKAGRRKSST